jgi:hypothetical protein
MFYGRAHILGGLIALSLITTHVAADQQAELSAAIAAIEANPQGPQGQFPPCQSPPEDASKQVKDCFDAACDAYRAAYAACDGDNNCQVLVAFQYSLALGLCGKNSWATVWYYGGTYGVAFEEKDVPEGVVRFDF